MSWKKANVMPNAIEREQINISRNNIIEYISHYMPCTTHRSSTTFGALNMYGT